MARVSFTLRRPDSDVDLGSYLRWDDSYGTPRTDFDSALRSDGLQVAPQTFDESFFEAVSVCYGEVDLTWAVNIATATSTPTVTGVVLVYSPNGEPQTIASGDILVESTNTYEYTHTGLTEGRWAYYSLFVHYESTLGDDYYERVASLSVLVVKNYGSTLMLWNRIPEYYRIQDVLQGDFDFSPCVGSTSTGVAVGPLFKYLSVMGFDIDRMRTMLDYQMVSSDPALANTEHLDALSNQLGATLQSTDLGGARLRNLLDAIGFFRRSKGTVDGVTFFARAVAGSDIKINQTTGAITVYSQRVNYITKPKNGSGIVTHRAAFDTEEFLPEAFSWTGASAGSGSYSVSGTEFTTTGTGASIGIDMAMIHLSSPVPVLPGDRVCFSVSSGIGTDAIKWVRVVLADETELGFQDTSNNAAGSVVFEVPIDFNGDPDTYVTGYIEYLVDLSAVPVFDNSLLMAERNHIGQYFDGDTVRGGWLIDSSSVSDYRWSGAANNSCSIFAEDYERTKAVINSLLFDVLPVTEESKYSIISYNAIPGFA